MIVGATVVVSAGEGSLQGAVLASGGKVYLTAGGRCDQFEPYGER